MLAVAIGFVAGMNMEKAEQLARQIPNLSYADERKQ